MMTVAAVSMAAPARSLPHRWVLGLEPGAVNYVPRVASDGTQVFVTVTLNERYPDDSRKQVVLAGTPIG